MKFVAVLLISVVPIPLFGQNVLEPYLWIKRPIIVFADSEKDPRFIQQLEFLDASQNALNERDIVVLTDTNPQKRSELRMLLRPKGFSFVLIGKDGGVKLRKASPWRVKEISRVIDKMPLRQQEMRAKGAIR